MRNSAALARTFEVDSGVSETRERNLAHSELLKRQASLKPQPDPNMSENPERLYTNRSQHTIEPVVAVPWVQPDSRAVVSFVALQEWEGYVIGFDEEFFRARLIDVTAGDEVESEEVELPLSDLDPEVREKVKLGAVFRWTIGYQIERGRPRLKGSQIVFRNIARPLESEIRAARERGAARAKNFRYE